MIRLKFHMPLTSIQLPDRNFLDKMFRGKRIKRYSRISVMRKIKGKPIFKTKRGNGHWMNKLRKKWNNRGY